jgi:gliding motility-associated-like protein
VGVNLSQYVGQTLTAIITNADCSQGGHYAYSYWDFECPPILNSSPAYCQGNQTTITGPASDPAGNPYTYTWYVNGQLYTGAPNATSQTITPIPQPGDTFAVHVDQGSGCGFWIPYIPVPLTINANFTLANNCGTVNFTDASTSPSAGPIIGWNWSFPGGNPSVSTNQNEVVTYPPGTYTVTLIATSQSGCKDTMLLPLTTGLPTAAFSTGPVCLGATTLFSDASVAPTGDVLNIWDWNFGDGSPNSNQQSPMHVYATAGTYSVTLNITTQAGCTNTITQTVTVNPIPVPAFTSNIVCFNTNPTTFTDQSTGATQWNWNFGDGNTSTQQNPTNTYATTGSFTVTLIVTNTFGCKDTLPLVAIVNPLPVALFTSVPVCFGDVTTFTDGSTVTPGGITGWSWNFGDPTSGAANTSTLPNPTHTFTGSGQFTVILTATSDSGCQSTTMIPANVNPPPTAAITPQNVCLNSLSNLVDASTFSMGNNVNGWDWNFGDGTPNSTQQNPSHAYTAAGTYTITLIVTTVNGCKDTTTNTVMIYQPPVALFNDSVKGCAPACGSMMDLSTSVDGTISTWQWSFPTATPPISSAQNPAICWYTPGVFDVQLIVTSTNGCRDTLLKPQYIYVYDWPVADFCVTPTLASINDPQFLFCDLWTSDVTNWMWDFGDGTSQDSISTDPAHNYSASITNNDFYKYTVSLAVQNQYGCWDTITHIVEILPEFTFYIPNTFTPNTDGMNELFFGKGRGIKDYEIWLFDRWGNMLWNCDYAGDNTDWDGPGQDGMPSFCKWDGVVVSGGVDMSGNSRQLMQEDVYVWKVTLIDIFDKRHTFVGHVNVVR